jgi:hypothetical protein
MNGNTMRLLSEYITELNRKDRERNAKTYSTVYDYAVTDTNGVKQDWEEPSNDNK